MPLEHDWDRPSQCPWCLVMHDAIANVTGSEMPQDGDVSMCIECGIISVVSSTSPTGLRRPTAAERRVFLSDPQIQQALVAWQIMNERRAAQRRRQAP